MAGINGNGDFVELISPHLKNLIIATGGDTGPVGRQFVKSKFEYAETAEHNDRHWHAEGQLPFGLERLYDNSAVIDLTMKCNSHCRYCLRGKYQNFGTLTEQQIDEVVEYLSHSGVREVLITGGDPLLAKDALNYLVLSCVRRAPDIKIYRIATRLFTHEPKLIDLELIQNISYLLFKNDCMLEIATQINHASEFTPDSIQMIKFITSIGVKIYAQNVLLKGVNDNLDDLVNLYNMIRYTGMESHYLFHCVPMRGISHFRTSVMKGLKLADQLVNSGLISGRCKPQYALMTDIGKVTLIEGSIIKSSFDSNFNSVLTIKTSYTKAQREFNNEHYIFPESVHVMDDGYLCVDYLDGNDD